MTQCCPYCDSALPKPGDKKRSHPQLGLYMKGIKIAFDNWPEQSHHQFDSWVELRYWLQVMAGYGEVVDRIPVTVVGAEAARNAAKRSIRATGGKGFPIVRGSELRIVVPSSINYATMEHAKFTELFDKVDRVVIEHVGRSLKELVTGQRFAA